LIVCLVAGVSRLAGVGGSFRSVFKDTGGVRKTNGQITVSNTGQFSKVNQPANRGRKKGAPNKTTTQLKEAGPRIRIFLPPLKFFKFKQEKQMQKKSRKKNAAL
jgi:hypothetical protein